MKKQVYTDVQFVFRKSTHLHMSVVSLFSHPTPLDLMENE